MTHVGTVNGYFSGESTILEQFMTHVGTANGYFSGESTIL